ncbi:1,4-dihydroxy-2-naphthoate octaprenyltransferase [Oceanisphaera profunda]|uniref:1,4-dihydroxy-2-naphthoate octaprenyltransferase n=1 Tax=Oceanisphaera profunda TaxID=1416627 RepID=A0A1Y0D4D8_9GAMM|nr:1,4-dihydroxy-2-naphthoate octaprenyltransferase [Oceanisphaera profunda]ART82398.1 1,4-dihydroxy-2-naphthoate octaprenyltransferase [Oceanisphaera profunda]
MPFSAWLLAIRLKTLPLALAAILLGAGSAAGAGHFNGVVLWLSLITALLLQVVSNLANDYGDGVRGTDSDNRSGPVRALASGSISARQLRLAIIKAALLAMGSGLLLLWSALGTDLAAWLGFMVLGVLALLAALGYTLGRRPYGYLGLGDIAVFIFFGPVAVLGTYYLMQPLTRTVELTTTPIWAALTSGLLSVAVLNINNIRDLDSDLIAGKRTLALRLGLVQARVYQLLILSGALLTGAQIMTGVGFLSLLALWPLCKALRLVLTQQGSVLNQALALTAQGTLLFCSLLALGLAFGGASI